MKEPCINYIWTVWSWPTDWVKIGLISEYTGYRKEGGVHFYWLKLVVFMPIFPSCAKRKRHAAFNFKYSFFNFDLTLLHQRTTQFKNCPALCSWVHFFQFNCHWLIIFHSVQELLGRAKNLKIGLLAKEENNWQTFIIQLLLDLNIIAANYKKKYKKRAGTGQNLSVDLMRKLNRVT